MAHGVLATSLVKSGSTRRSHHEKVSLGVVLVSLESEDAATLQVLGQRDAQMRIVEHAEVVDLGSICGIDLTRLDGELRLS